MKPVNVAAISDTGRVREANEDSFLVDLDLFIFAVADGMGGHVAGEIASATAIEALRANVANGVDIASSISKANVAVRAKAKSQEELSGMGTTLTAMGFDKNDSLAIAHVGDSRAYLYRITNPETNEYVFERITKDHSLVEELVDIGEITKEEADVHPRRNVVTRALGIGDDVEVDTYNIEFKIGDRYLLCSDGLTSMVRDEDIEEIIKAQQSPKECAQELVRKANNEGGSDNITVVVLDVLSESVAKPDSINSASSISPQEANLKKYSKKGRIGFSARVALAALVLFALLFGAFKTLEHYSTQGYFLDEIDGQVVLMSGTKDGAFIWEPKVDTQTGLEFEKLSQGDQLRVERNTQFDSRQDALNLLEAMRNRQSTAPEIEILDPNEPVIPNEPGLSTSPSITIQQGTSVSND